jgi:hypothetical protein
MAMAERLTERFDVGDRVEIAFVAGDEAPWYPALVVLHAPPGVWVQTTDGRFWFVTNTRRIRPLDDEANDESRSRAETPGA